MPDIRTQNNPLFGSNSVKKFHLSHGREEETGPRNYGRFLILIRAVSAAIPRGMAIAGTTVSTFIGIFCLSYLLRIASREIEQKPLSLAMKVGILKPWQSEALTRKHWSKSRKQLIRSRSKAKSFWNPTSLSASYRKPKSGFGRGCRRRRRSPSHASHFASKPVEKAGKGPTP